MERGHGREVAARDGRLARPVLEVAGELRPERCFEGDVLARHRHPGVAEHEAGLGDVVVELLQARGALGFLDAVEGIGQHVQREVVISNDELVADQVVQRLLQLFGL